MFSKRAAKVQSACTDLMWEGLDLRLLFVELVFEKGYFDCLNGVTPTTTQPLYTSDFPTPHLVPPKVQVQPPPGEIELVPFIMPLPRL